MNAATLRSHLLLYVHMLYDYTCWWVSSLFIYCNLTLIFLVFCSHDVVGGHGEGGCLAAAVDSSSAPGGVVAVRRRVPRGPDEGKAAAASQGMTQTAKHKLN